MTMTNGKSLAKMNQRTFLHSSCFLCGLCSFIPQVAMHLFLEYKLLKEAQRHQNKTIQLTNNGPAIATSSFLQLPHDRPAHFKQTFVPTTKASTGHQANNNCHSSLIDITAPQAFSALTATTTATMTQVLAKNNCNYKSDTKQA